MATTPAPILITVSPFVDQLYNDLKRLQAIEGTFFGLLDPYELASFDRLEDAGLASKQFTGLMGYFGFARVKLTPGVN